MVDPLSPIDLPTDGLLTTNEVAALLRICPRTVRRYGAIGRLQRVAFSRKAVRYTAASVAALISPDNETRPADRPSASKMAAVTGRHEE